MMSQWIDFLLDVAMLIRVSLMLAFAINKLTRLES